MNSLRWCSVALFKNGQDFPRAHSASSNWTHLPCQSVKMVGKQHRSTAFDSELSLANHVHQLRIGNSTA